MKKSELLELLNKAAEGKIDMKELTKTVEAASFGGGGKPTHFKDLSKDLIEKIEKSKIKFPNGLYLVEEGSISVAPLEKLDCRFQIYYKGLKAAKEELEKEKAAKEKAAKEKKEEKEDKEKAAKKEEKKPDKK